MAAMTAPINYTNGRMRLADAMSGGGMAGGNMATAGGAGGFDPNGAMTNGNMASNPFSAGGSTTGGNTSSGNFDPNAGSGSGSSANQPADTSTPASTPAMTNLSSPEDYAKFNNYTPQQATSYYQSIGYTPAGGMPAGSGGAGDTQVGGLSAYPGGTAAPPQTDPSSFLHPMDAAQSQQGASAAYQAATQYFQPDFDRQRSSLESQLASQGFTRGSQGYTQALDDMQRQQDLARTNAALNAQGVGFGQAMASNNQNFNQGITAQGQGFSQYAQMIQNALAQRAQDVAMRGQDRGVDSAGQSAAASIGAANIGANSANYRSDLDAQLGLQGLGLQQDNQNFNQMMQLMSGARGGVNAPNFGAATPLDVGGAYGIASNNNNAQQNRNASDRNGLYQLGGSLLGGYLNNFGGAS